MKKLLAENMQRFGTKNLTESDIQRLNEVAAPEILQASMLNITPQDVQPFVDMYNAAFKAAAQEQKKIDPEFPVADQYVKLNVETKPDPNGVIQNNYEIVPIRGGADAIRKINSKGITVPFKASTYSFTQYKDSKPDDPDNVKITNGTWHLSRRFNNNGEFDQARYNTFIKGNVRTALKRKFANEPISQGAQRVAALILATAGAPYDHAFDADGNLKVRKAREVAGRAGSAVLRTGKAIQAAIDKMIDNKYAQFHQAVDSIMPR